MTGPGTPPPAELAGRDDPTRLLAAAWYADQLADHEQHGGHPGTACGPIHDLITGAIEHGVSCLDVDTDLGRQPLHSLFAPYRRRPGGLAEKTAEQHTSLQAIARSVALEPRDPRRDPRWLA